MAYIVSQYAYFIVFLTFYVGQGDGRLKKTTKDTLKHDLKLYKKMIEKIDGELITFYEEYPNDPLLDYYQEDLNLLRDYVHDSRQKQIKDSNFNDINNLKTNENNINSDSTIENKSSKAVNVNTTNKVSFNNERYSWPKFEDILLAMGKKYDWKFDRWIKIKDGMNQVKKDSHKTKATLLKSSEFHDKHKFKYRIVKLNRTKNKRNIVIAVTAVR